MFTWEAGVSVGQDLDSGPFEWVSGVQKWRHTAYGLLLSPQAPEGPQPAAQGMPLGRHWPR